MTRISKRIPQKTLKQFIQIKSLRKETFKNIKQLHENI